jgi:hypothetical protein
MDMYKAAVLAIVVFGSALTCTGQDHLSLQPLKVLPVEIDETAYAVEDGEATVNNDMIKRIAIGQEKVTVSFRNQTDEKRRPLYTIELYNAFGLFLGSDQTGKGLFGSPGYIEPGDIGTERLHVQWLPLDRVFAKSAILLPDQWKTVKWVVVKEANR